MTNPNGAFSMAGVRHNSAGISSVGHFVVHAVFLLFLGEVAQGHARASAQTLEVLGGFSSGLASLHAAPPAMAFSAFRRGRRGIPVLQRQRRSSTAAAGSVTKSLEQTTAPCLLAFIIVPGWHISPLTGTTSSGGVFVIGARLKHDAVL